jgi:TonB family protein
MFRLLFFLLLFTATCCRAQDTITVHASCSQKFDSTLHRSYYVLVDESPAYAGGEDSLRKILVKNIRFPQTAGCVEGTVYISMIVEADGSVSNVAVKKGFSAPYDREALRVAKLLTAWTPGKCRGEAVAVERIIPIRFKVQ